MTNRSARPIYARHRLLPVFPRPLRLPSSQFRTKSAPVLSLLLSFLSSAPPLCVPHLPLLCLGTAHHLQLPRRPLLPCPVPHRPLRAFSSFLPMPQQPARLAPPATCGRPEATLRHLRRSFPHPHVLSLSLSRQPRPCLLRANPKCHSSSLPPLSGPTWAVRRHGLPLALPSARDSQMASGTRPVAAPCHDGAPTWPRPWAAPTVGSDLSPAIPRVRCHDAYEDYLVVNASMCSAMPSQLQAPWLN
ncbi:hypothetical protein BDA96_05G238000 [Sorghum bicolor]|uniref:Uncharacterized protein n=2 Tax=Sorghum bicolor TaxID=4558 RepID=A0A921QZT3_SORBI|nr:hypothetical protein BDA96_05G238000 [Sorghum bicolor]KXG29171.1 hypothetical protein SORBI_3005G222100 [Sorghum bicolor]